MSDAGWIKIHKKMKESKVWYYTPSQFKVWMTILMEVNWKPGWGRFDGEEVKVEPGQMLTSRKHLSDCSGVGKNTVRDTLTKLEKDDMIKCKRTSQGTLITVLNWGKYQKTENQGTNEPNSEANNEGDSEGDNDEDSGPNNEPNSEANIHEELEEEQELEDKQLEQSSSEDGGAVVSEPESFEEKQSDIVDCMENASIPVKAKYKLAGWAINGGWPLEKIKKGFRRLSNNQKLEELYSDAEDGENPFAYLTDFLDNLTAYTGPSKNGQAHELPPLNELNNRPESEWRVILPSIYRDERYPAMAYQGDVEAFMKKNDCSEEVAREIMSERISEAKDPVAKVEDERIEQDKENGGSNRVDKLIEESGMTD